MSPFSSRPGPEPESQADLPIGIFDSGVGGLTVLSAIRRRLPSERLLYLGDTARLPYGTKSRNTVSSYALQATGKLVERRIKLLVVACNTASAAALGDLQQAYPDLPVVGVVEPGARAACSASRSGDILVLATESTIRQQAYQKAIRLLAPQARVRGIACTLFVAIAEEGWTSGPEMEAVARRYLEPVFGAAQDSLLPRTSGAELPDCIVLACTHFPPLAGAIRAVVGNGPVMVDSAATTAVAVEETLLRHGLLRSTGDQDNASLRFLTTDAPERFARVGGIFLQHPIVPSQVELVTL